MSQRISDKVRECERSAVTTWAEGATELMTSPWLVYISVTNICNNRCGVCAIHRAMRDDHGTMSPEIFNRIIDQLPEGVRKVYLFKQGEPFINRNLEDFVRALREKRPDIYIAIHTNGIIARKERVEKILPKIDALGISISAISALSYRNVHNTNNFEKVMQNLGDISGVLLNMPEDERPHVFIDYVRQDANIHEKESDVVDFYRKGFPGLSSVDFHWVFNFQGETEEGNMEIYERLRYGQFPCCVFPWSAMTFCYDGRVSYCFVEPRENHFLGNINSQPLSEIWNGKEYRAFRERMSNKDFGGLEAEGIFCNRCAWLWSMQSQSPRNLIQGYSVELGGDASMRSLGNLMDLPIEDSLDLGLDLYLKGEIHQAAGIFHTLSSFKLEPEMHGILGRMINYCNNIFRKYENLPLWQKMLLNEGIRHEDRTCRYYPIRED